MAATSISRKRPSRARAKDGASRRRAPATSDAVAHTALPPYELGISSTCPAWIPPPDWILPPLAERSALMLTP